jgi:hypothetical protein
MKTVRSTLQIRGVTLPQSNFGSVCTKRLSVGSPVDRVRKKQKESIEQMKQAVILALSLAVGTAAALAGGNGLGVNGTHFNLNIIGKAQCPTDDKTGGNVIFVLLNGGDSAGSLNGQNAGSISKVNKIYLTESPDNTTFAVLDGNACDTDGALFELPNPTAGYTIWARALATPGGNATMTTCATDPLTGDIVCSTQNVLLPRYKGQSLFSCVTSQLTTITTATLGTVPIFSNTLQNYFWNYNNMGDRLVQLRLYPAQ